MIEYRPAFGFGLWIGATVLDLLLVGGHLEGALSLAGFAVALAWAVGPRSLLGLDADRREP